MDSTDKIEKYKVIHIRDYYPSPENPASSPWVYDQVRSLQEFQIDSLVISPTPYLPSFLRSRGRFYLYPKPHSKVLNYKGTEVVRPQFLKIPNNKLIALNFRNISASILKSTKKSGPFSLIHAHFGQNGIAALKLKEKLNIPLITSFYGYDAGRLAPIFGPYYKVLAQKGDLFLALSEDMKSDLQSYGFPAHKIKIHHLGIDLKQFKPIQKKDPVAFVYLVIARLDESKGVQDVIQAFKLINNPDMQLRIVGDGVFKGSLEKLVKELGLDNQVIFINNFKAENPRQVVINEMQNCDVALLTSFISSNGAKEGTPVVLMEAQACGKPCIATNHAGIPEVVIDKKTGYLVKERDINSIAKYMEQLYINTDLVETMGANALMHIIKEFNQEVQMRKLIEIYSNLIQGMA